MLKDRGCDFLLIKGYGQCEVGGTATLSKDNDRDPVYGDVGIPLSQVCVSTFDMDTGEEKKIGELGEIRVLSPARMKEYFKRPEETKKKFQKDSAGRIWVCTGDAGLVRNDGRIVVMGRINDSFISKTGKRVFLFHIKNAILENQYVKRCEVVKMDDSEGGLLAAHVVLAEDVNVETAINDIHKKCVERLDCEEIPEAYKVRDSFNLNSTSGKIDVEALKHDKTELIFATKCSAVNN